MEEKEYVILVEINGIEERIPYRSEVLNRDILLKNAMLHVANFVKLSGENVRTCRFVNIIPV